MKRLFLTLLGVVAATIAQAQEYTPRLPEAAARVERSGGRKALPDPVMKIATTTITVHIPAGQSHGTGVLYFVDPFTGEADQFTPSIDGGTLTYTFEQYATQKVSIAVGNGRLRPIVNPGDKVEAWADPAAQFVYYGSGDFMDENNALATLYRSGDIKVVASSNMANGAKRPIASVEGFVGDVVRKTIADNAAVDAMKGVSGAVKESLKMDNVTAGLSAVAKMRMYLQVLGYGSGINMEEHTDALGALSQLDLGTPKLLYGADFPSGAVAVAKAVNAAGTAPTVEPDKAGWMLWGGAMTALTKVRNRQPLTDGDRAAVAAAPQYFGELITHVGALVEQKYKGAIDSGEFTINPTPKYADPADLVEIIAKKYPGKVVFVDFWATWCGPCLQGMRTIKPLKPWMKERGIVSVYITDTSSPETRWTLSLPGIGGEHYYFTAQEYAAVIKKYGIDSIPTYLIFDRTGAKVFQSTGYPGNDTLKAEFEKLL